ncbi:structural protein [Flavobacterium soyangense]|uniref:Structural protein n=1 Tax=Flavobacterium soyangense TaxID=2023265 RepID=A0A930Y1A0_9FLAO|nr:structural protein [Flavobacterium soyangense]MBF2709249.1 structural protein [Flavobacterium soyangense]
MSNLSRGIRNNNPGNLISTNIQWLGKIPLSKNTDGKFEQFETIELGIRAMFKDLINDINKGKNTVRKLITEYAPPNENNTGKYIKDVCSSIGVTPDQIITSVNYSFLLMLGKAIIKKENGSDASLVSDKQIIKGIKLLGDVSTSLLKVSTVKNNLAFLIPIFLLFYTVFTISL